MYFTLNRILILWGLVIDYSIAQIEVSGTDFEPALYWLKVNSTICAIDLSVCLQLRRKSVTWKAHFPCLANFSYHFNIALFTPFKYHFVRLCGFLLLVSNIPLKEKNTTFLRYNLLVKFSCILLWLALSDTNTNTQASYTLV